MPGWVAGGGWGLGATRPFCSFVKTAIIRYSMRMSLRLLGWFACAVGCVGAQEPVFRLQIAKIAAGPSVQISWPSQNGFAYQIEFATNLTQPAWKPLAANIAGNGAVLSTNDLAAVTSAPRYYRGVKVAATGGQISPNAVDPIPGVVYPEQTVFGSGLLGLQFTLPRAWKGGLRQGSSTMLFGSDTEPGLVLSFLTLAGDAQFVARMLGQSFQTADGYFQLKSPATVEGGRIAIEWELLGQGIDMRIVGVAHPSGGVIAFAGLFTPPNRAVTERVLGDFVASTVTVPRQTRTDLVNLISGKSFSWAKSSSTGNGGSSGSLSRWSENNAFFCPGTYEITTRSESSYSGTLSGGGFYGGGSSSSSTEAGDWTIIDTPAGPGMIMLSSSGVQSALISVSGNTVYFGNQEFAYSRPHFCP